MNTELSTRYINLKYGSATRQDWKTLAIDCGREIENIKREKSDVFARYPGIHGRFQQSQLDVLDIRENKTCAMFDNCTKMMVAAR